MSWPLTIDNSFKLPKERNDQNGDLCLYHNGKEWQNSLCLYATEGNTDYLYLKSTETDLLPWSSEVRWFWGHTDLKISLVP